jgi:hypothetical protein
MDPADIIRRAIEIGNPTGAITDQLNDLVPSGLSAPEDIEPLLSTLSEKGRQIVEGHFPKSSATPATAAQQRELTGTRGPGLSWDQGINQLQRRENLHA